MASARKICSESCVMKLRRSKTGAFADARPPRHNILKERLMPQASGRRAAAHGIVGIRITGQDGRHAVSRAARDATGSAVEAAWRRINRGTVVALVVAAALLAGAATYVVSVLWPRWPG